ncbi:MAG: hypothetical protein VX278_23715, partial [Myxococcota bacterium]|nr:hypothetical protein [Myxococcota bacterium]
WSRWSARWMEWIWAVRAWKDRKISAVISAGKTHNPEYYDTFKSLLSKVGYHTSPSKLWSDAINYTSWSKEDWCNFVILKTGWVLSPLSEPYAIKEADRQKNARYRVAWHVALIRFGRYNSLIWLHDQYYDVVTEREKQRRSYYNRNPYKKHIKLSYIYEGMFAVESFVAIGNKPEGEGFPLLQRMMEERQDQCLDIFRLNMLRLSYFGGPVDFIGIGYTCSEQQVNLESVAMREHSHDKDALLSALIPLLNGFDHYAHDPYELANVGGNWYNVARLLFEINSKSYSVDESSPRETWQQLAMLLSVSDSKLRARGVDLYFRRHRLGDRKGRFEADIDNFYRQLSDKPIPCLPLSQNREEVSKKQAHDLAFDAYIGLIRKTDFDINYRREALRYLVSMCNADLDPSRSLATLHVAFSMGAEQLRWDAYGYLITQQASHLREKISF